MPEPFQNPPDQKLPDITKSVLDAEQIHTLFRDVVALTEIMEIIPKQGPRDPANITSDLTLDAACAGLLNGTYQGVQIRYRFDGGWWWDTLITVPGGYRVIRIRHDPNEGIVNSR